MIDTSAYSNPRDAEGFGAMAIARLNLAIESGMDKEQLRSFISDEIDIMERETEHATRYRKVYDENVAISRVFEVEALEWARRQLEETSQETQ